jgi:hypothetical protein
MKAISEDTIDPSDEHPIEALLKDELEKSFSPINGVQAVYVDTPQAGPVMVYIVYFDFDPGAEDAAFDASMDVVSRLREAGEERPPVDFTTRWSVGYHPTSVVPKSAQAVFEKDLRDPKTWGELVQLVDRMPRDERVDPPEPEPFI